MKLFSCLWGSCAEVFQTRSGLAAHVAIHIEVSDHISCKWRTCAEKDAVYGNLREIARHLAQEDHIGQVFYISKSMEALSKSKTKHKEFSCSTCGRVRSI
jgi:hypothetical protein